jgi:methylthioribose-1-phosphate isomerase
MREAWERISTSSNKAAELTPIETTADRDSALGLISTLIEFERAISGTVNRITEIRESLEPLRGTSRDLNQALRRVDRALDEVGNILSIGSSSAARVRNIIQERLDEL